ncbi:MAG TPA: lysophospholipid acyltransferase family protein [Polyangiaceae bacterium]
MPVTLSAALEDPRDLRQGGQWTILQRSKNDLLWWLASLALIAARPLPLVALRTLGRALGRTAHLVVRSARRTARENVARVYPGLGPRAQHDLVRRCFLSMGELLAETVAMLRTKDAPPLLVVSDDARSVLDAARAEGRGVLFASAHLGPWERVAASLVAAGVPLVALVRESYDPRFSGLYERLRGRHGVRVVWRASPGAAARILRTLRGGGVLGVPMDLRSRVPSCDAPFLGHPALTAVGPARIALRARAPVVVGTAAPGPDGSLVVTATRIDCSDLTRDEGGALELTRRINGELSRRILALPDAWVWMHERWIAGTGV